VYITNHPPRVQPRLKTALSDIFATKPRIVYAPRSGQGQRGPDAEAQGNDNLSSLCRADVGSMLSDTSGQLTPQRGAIDDGPSGIAHAAGVLAGLLDARQTGEGFEVNTSFPTMGMCTVGPRYRAHGAHRRGATTSRGRADTTGPPGSSPLAAHYIAADGRTLALSMTNENRYGPCASRALGLDNLIDCYPDATQRQDHAEVLRVRFATVIASLPAVRERRSES
jgi:alpha-methylacyl-CoA racemase